MRTPWGAKHLSVLGLALAGAIVAAHASPSGVAIAVVQSAEANGETGQRILNPEGPVYSGDEIVTGAVGEAQIRFRDDTRLVVGPKSKLVIDAFVFGNNTARDISINAVRGAFRFISGNSRKDAYRITTPTATIGVRGTEIDLAVDARATHAAFISGAGRICQRQPASGTTRDERPSCVEVVGNCSLTVIQPGSSPRQVTSIPDRNRDLNWYFRYLRNQSSLQEAFRVDTSICGLAQVVPPRGSAPPPPPAVQQEEEPPPPPPPPPPEGGKNNNGFGNGADTSGEGPGEQDNPGNGGAGGSNGNNGNNGNANGKNK